MRVLNMTSCKAGLFILEICAPSFIQKLSILRKTSKIHSEFEQKSCNLCTELAQYGCQIWTQHT